MDTSPFAVFFSPINLVNTMSKINISMSARYANVVSEVMASAKSKLLQFCISKAIEFNLVPKTWTTAFDFSTSSGANKAIKKIAAQYNKLMLRLIPYLNFAPASFVGLNPYTLDSITISLGASEPISDLKHIKLKSGENPWRAAGVLAGQAANLSIQQLILKKEISALHSQYIELGKCKEAPFYSIGRYCRYLNYMFRKNHIPLVANPKIVTDVSKVMETKAVRLLKRGITDSNSKDFYITVSCSIDIALCSWSYDSPSAYVAVMSAAAASSTPGQSPLYDRMASNASSWASNNLYSGRTDRRTFYRFSPEKIFFHLQKGLKIVETLSRKVKYEPAAYIFRDPIGE